MKTLLIARTGKAYIFPQALWMPTFNALAEYFDDASIRVWRTPTGCYIERVGDDPKPYVHADVLNKKFPWPEMLTLLIAGAIITATFLWL